MKLTLINIFGMKEFDESNDGSGKRVQFDPHQQPVYQRKALLILNNVLARNVFTLVVKSS